jgi:hypothetical protein
VNRPADRTVQRTSLFVGDQGDAPGKGTPGIA